MVEARLGDLEDELAEQDKTVRGPRDFFRVFLKTRVGGHRLWMKDGERELFIATFSFFFFFGRPYRW